MDDRVLNRLAELVAQRNAVSAEISALTGRPAQLGHLGEFIAAGVFDIALEDTAVNKGFDGRFRSGEGRNSKRGCRGRPAGTRGGWAEHDGRRGRWEAAEWG